MSYFTLYSYLDVVLFVVIVGVSTLVLDRWLRNSAGESGFSRWILAMLVVLVAGGALLAVTIGNYEKRRIERTLSGMAPTYANAMARRGHDRINIHTPADDPVYLDLIRMSADWVRSNSMVMDVYTVGKNDKGQFVLLVDAETDYDRDGRFEGERESRTPIGEVLESDHEQLTRAFAGETVFSDAPYTDRWGSSISCYLPIPSADGTIRAVVGVDYPAEQYISGILMHRLAGLGVAATVVAILLGCATVNTALGAEIAERGRIEQMLRTSRNELQDLTDKLQERVEQRTRDLEHAKTLAEASNRAKSEFLANMSHEIRTPMTAIVGYADLLLHPDQTAEDRRQWVQIIRRNGQHLLMVVNDILDLSRIEAGKMAIEKVPCSPLQVVAEVASLMRVRADEKGLDLKVEYNTLVPETIHTDPTRLRQVLMNLVSNAIKFTESGGVRIAVNLIEDDEPHLHFDIIDTGIGMSSPQRSRLFQMFGQADTSTTRRFGGAGLGLAISQRLTEMLGGTISVSSELGKGSTFSFNLPTGPLNGIRRVDSSEPLSAAPEESFDPKPALSLNGARILLAEDGQDNQTLISWHLERSGAVVELAENGQIAVQKVESAAQANAPFDLVLMDMQMPEMDGYEAASRLRSAGFKTLPIIALTAHAMAGDRERCINAGCTDYLTKPIDDGALIQCVASHIDAQAESRAA